MELFSFVDGGLSREPDHGPEIGPDIPLVTPLVTIERRSPESFETDALAVTVTATSASVNVAADAATASTETVSSEPQGIPESHENDMRVATAVSVHSFGLELSPMRAAQNEVRRFCHSSHMPWVSPADFESGHQVLGPFEVPKSFTEYIIKAVRVDHRPRIFPDF